MPARSFILAFVVAACEIAVAQGQSNSLSAHVQVYQDEKHGYALDVSVSNIGAETLAVSHHLLPWRSPLYLTMVAVVGSTGEMMSPMYQIGDPPAARATIAPRQTLSGKVWLNSHFAELEKKLRSSEVIIFWTFRISSVGNQYSERFAGAVVLPLSRTPEQGKP